MFTRINSILKTTPRRSKSNQSILALQIRQVAKQELDKILKDYPEEITKTVKIKSFKNNTLYIVSPTLLSAELHTRSEGLRDDINKSLGGEIIKKFRFRKA